MGSASPELIKNCSETLAGRISFVCLNGFSLNKIPDFKTLWIRGGFPRSVPSENDQISFRWRENYITTFLERDIQQLGINIPAQTLRRFWIMISHYHSQILNFTEIGKAFGISDHTVRKYIDILTGTFMVRVLQTWYVNLGKRIVKKPKIYLCDSGLFHSLQTIESFEELHSHPKLGASWEGFALEQVCKRVELSRERFFFYHTYGGAELDLFFQIGGKNYGCEFKYLDAPKMTKSIQSIMEDLKLEYLWIIYPGSDVSKIEKNIEVITLSKYILK